MVCPAIASTDLNGLRLSATFGEACFLAICGCILMGNHIEEFAFEHQWRFETRLAVYCRKPSLFTLRPITSTTRTRKSPSSYLLDTSGTPLPGVQCPAPACSQSRHPDARRSSMEWRCHHLAASRPLTLLLQYEVPTPHLHRALARPCGALGAAGAQPVARPPCQSEHPVAGDPSRPLPRDDRSPGLQRRRFRPAQAPYLRYPPPGTRTAAASGPPPRPGDGHEQIQLRQVLGGSLTREEISDDVA